VALLSIDSIKADLPLVALLAIVLYPNRDTVTTSHLHLTTHFLIFPHDGGIAYFLI